ncbi:MAG: helix-hairpin-helix domain-containing protein [Vicinamibacterales bacterium]
MTRVRLPLLLLVTALFVTAPMALRGQVGQGILDANTATEAELTALPGMTPAIAKALVAARPFGNVVELDKFLESQKLTVEQRTAVYGKAFIHVNLNTGTREEILLIPGAGNRMVREFGEYRPWKTFGQFDKEIGKYVNAQEVARLKQYVFIPVNLNTASDADILSIPGAGNRMVREFKEYRPWKTQAQFEKEIGKYVNAKEVARLWRYVVIE